MFEAGSVVRSLSGHDAGGCFIMMRREGNLAYICDGAVRRMACPKRKNVTHLELVDVSAATTLECDAHIRRALKERGLVRINGYFRLKEEGCIG